MALASGIKAIIHEIGVVGVEIDIAPMAFIKPIYPTYSHYLESLQASGQLKPSILTLRWRKLQNMRKFWGRT
jgi:hypothetical protein